MAMQFDSQQVVGGRPVFRFADPATGRSVLVTDPLQAQRLGAPVGRLSAANVMGPAPGAPAAVQRMAAPVRTPDMRTASLLPMGPGGAVMTEPPKPQTSAEALAPPKQVIPRAPIDTSAAGIATPEQLAQQGAAPAAPGAVTPEQLEARRRIGEEAASLRSRGTYIAPQEAGFRDKSRYIEGADPEQVDKLRTEAEELRQREAEALRSKLDRDIAINEATAAGAEEDYWKKKIAASDMEDEVTRKRVAYQAKSKELDALEQDASSATVDQDRYFKKKPGGRFLAAVAIGLGEFARGLREDSTNGALEIINASIEKDIQEQKDEIAANKDAVNLKVNAYARQLADGDDPRIAEEKLRLAQERVAHSDLLRSSAMARNVVAKEAFDAAASKLAQQHMDRRISIEGMQKTHIDQQYQAARAGGMQAPTMATKAKESTDEVTYVSNQATLKGLPSELNPTAQGEGAKAEAIAKAKGDVVNPGGMTKEETAQARLVLNLIDNNWAQYSKLVKENKGTVLPDGTVEGASFPWDLPGGDTEHTADVKAQAIAAGLGSATIANDGRELGEPSKKLLIAEMEVLENTTGKIQGNLKSIAAKRQEILRKLNGAAPGSSAGPSFTRGGAP